MHLLTRFFSQKNFLDAFISGKLYMNTLDYFWNNGFEEQKDIFEGVVCTVPVKDFNGFPMDFQAAQASDYHFRAEGYKFCNVLCFYKIDFILERGLLRYDLNDDMSKFGEYVAIITNNTQHDTTKKRSRKSGSSCYFRGMRGYISISKSSGFRRLPGTAIFL